MSDDAALKKIRCECTHPHDQVDPRRYDGVNTVCHRCKRHVSISVSHYANGETVDQQYHSMVKKLGTIPAEFPPGATGVCSNCGQWQYPVTGATPDCFNECRRRGFATSA